MKKRREMIFKNQESLFPIVKVMNEVELAIESKERSALDSSIPLVVGTVLGTGIGGVGSFALLYGMGTVGLSGAGIMSGLAATGSVASALIGGALSASVMGIFLVTSPIAICGVIGSRIALSIKNKQLNQQKSLILNTAKKLIVILDEEIESLDSIKGNRYDYLFSLRILLEYAINDLTFDLS